MHTAALRHISRNSKKSSGPVMSEARLRRIIRDELSRQILVQEGFMDSIKKPFQKLGEKAKAWVTQKSTELAKKATEAVKSLQLPDDMKSFLASVESQEGGTDIKGLAQSIPGLSESMSSLEELKGIDFMSLIEAAQTESYSIDSARLDIILAEEKYEQKLESMRTRLSEAVVVTAISVWYGFSKTVVTTLGLLVFLLEGGAKLCKVLGLKKAEHVLEKVAHFLEKIEDWFVAKAIFPAPVQYAAYLALSGGKKLAGKKEKTLSFKEFQSPENKETKESVIKGLKIALLCVIIVEALLHVAHALHDFFENLYKSAEKVLHAGEAAGIEGRGIAKLGAELGKAGSETAKDVEALGGVMGTTRRP